jgi:hypothetical protein
MYKIMEYRLLGFYSIRLIAALTILLLLCHCANEPRREWDNIDYSKVRDRHKYENDDNYTPPSITSCTSDDLYTCN